MTALRPMTIDAAARERLRILFIAKNALWDGELHPEDGNHALYHREMRQVLEGLGLNLVIADRFEVLFENPEVDFVFPLLNRAGFFNSEMLCPLLCERKGIPYLGASPILRGLADDKHLAKRAARAADVPTAPWAIFRRGAPVDLSAVPPATRYVVKPNASSASWGVNDATDLASVERAVADVHALGHDAIVEPFLQGSDVEVPVITVRGEPTILPMMIFRQADPSHLRTYREKRDLVDRSQKYSLDPFENADMAARIADLTRKAWNEYRPFDYGRFEFRVNEDTGEITFLELNLNCNLWSQKVFGRAAALAGWSQPELIETILAESLARHGLMAR
ncbi:D-alanine--D-alanine ligase family protein [Pelagerythrobacter marinus]|uniref:D-alanine--D-alanine ligase family protein n=1 Tax=Pelagerythrobacter marinus TaxID=538382 RepID=UPI0020373358|nr:phosphoribosylglycinamide synthetase [Pelagerythrobacter marinus]MEC9067009.1 phosphoribosylglycinamide synthetase [Pseudomonadota bacterium]USA38317.1 phosphoribosylglycinamide synthetase [Pelagerythrobacter marinus]WPZ07721.1 phosphoribosylglycinamide synthetase [Pelagerythrobacter marinus]